MELKSIVNMFNKPFSEKNNNQTELIATIMSSGESTYTFKQLRAFNSEQLNAIINSIYIEKEQKLQKVILL